VLLPDKRAAKALVQRSALATPADGRLFLLRSVLAARFHVGAYLTGVEAADEVIALSPRRI